MVQRGAYLSKAVLGEVLREARIRANWSRDGLERRTKRRLTAAAIGGYERGERAISVERFVELASAIGCAPEELLGRAIARTEPRSRRELTVDLSKLGSIDAPVRDAVSGFAHATRIRRNDFQAELITLRASDLAVIADRAALEPNLLIRGLGASLVRVGPAGGA